MAKTAEGMATRAPASGCPALRTRRRFLPSARIVLIAVLVASVVCGSMVWSSSGAVFSATTANPTNSFTAGTVTVSDDDGGGVLFNVSSLKPGSTNSHCIKATYTGNLTTAGAGVRVYASDYTGTGLGSYVTLTIEQDTAGAPTGVYGNCGNFAGTSIYSGTMATFAAKTTWATGVGTWAPTAAAQTKVYKFTWTLNDDNGAQNKTSGIKFWWEAQTA
jgi:hypothetical protein